MVFAFVTHAVFECVPFKLFSKLLNPFKTDKEMTNTQWVSTHTTKKAAI